MEKKEFDTVVVGELNADLILNNIESFPEIGREKLAGDMFLTLGSSSAIFANNLRVLGAKVAFIGKIGKDNFGDLIIDKLNSSGVDTSMVIRDEKLKTGVTIVLNFGEDRAMVTYSGAMNELTIKDITKEKLKSAKHLHFSSYFLQEGLKNDIGVMFRTAKENNMTTSFDMQWDPAEKWEIDYKKILPFVNVFLPNEREMFYLTKEKEIKKGLTELSKYANTVVVKMGNKGSASLSNGEIMKIDPFRNTKVVDAIGAGDSFNAGFIYQFIKGEKINKCMKFGNLMGAVSTTEAGGITAFKSLKLVKQIAEDVFNYTW